MPTKGVIPDFSKKIDQEKPRLYRAAYNLTKYGFERKYILGVVRQAMNDANDKT